MVPGAARTQSRATEQAMVIWFLRLFPVFLRLAERVDMQARELHAREGVDSRATAMQSELAEVRESLHNLQMEKLMLQDRLDAALTDKDRLWNTMQDALDNERNSLRMQVNHAVQKSGGGIPYPDAHSLPAASVARPQQAGPVGRRGRLLPSEAAAQQSSQFIKDFVQAMEPAS